MYSVHTLNIQSYTFTDNIIATKIALLEAITNLMVSSDYTVTQSRMSPLIWCFMISQRTVQVEVDLQSLISSESEVVGTHWLYK